jgi:hypothetical protein
MFDAFRPSYRRGRTAGLVTVARKHRRRTICNRRGVALDPPPPWGRLLDQGWIDALRALQPEGPLRTVPHSFPWRILLLATQDR